MKHATILVPHVQTANSTIACIVGAYQLFTGANDYWQKRGENPLFKIETAGVANESAFINGLLTIKPQVNIASLKKTDLILIPSLTPEFQLALDGNIKLIDWIREQYQNGAEVASMCTGAFMLASSGLLDKRSCSIHWNSADRFRSLFPNVQLKTEKLITDENGIYTNGGGYSFLNLLLYLVEKYYDRETAIYCSKTFQVEIDRQTQSAFAIFTGQKSHGDEVVKKAQEYIEANFHEKISVADLSKRFAVGRRNFDRRFIKATGNTPLEYLQRVKIESAKKAFETTRKTVNEVMYEVGYSDEKAFREVFRKITGLSPLTYRNKYNKEAVPSAYEGEIPRNR
ncbi:AraC family transcriptional regulator [Parapedobacter defluvii]|uniref:AraC family transcriptional regulator n=1 Tax=Parapedobacter defluvii TaxID=2045106 RepID=A0ABQ1LED3_9SPHI|nr:helix-turn-helix domain-containing protein [Parapedobacter defluvii]GGC22075.1 AraC family transcriptional regulator [Parapedobacter defluvii]